MIAHKKDIVLSELMLWQNSMILDDLSEVVENSFHHQFMCQTFLINADGLKKMK